MGRDAAMKRTRTATTLVLLFAALALPGMAKAAVIFKSQATAANFTTATGTLNGLAPSGSNTMLLVGVSSEGTTVSGIKWGGSSGTALAVVPGCTASHTVTNTARIEIWFLANPNPNASPATVVITMSGTGNAYAGAAVFVGVGSLGTCVTANGGTGSTSNSLSPSVPTGGAAFDTIAVNTISSATVTVGSGQTSVLNLGSSGSAGAASYRLAPVSTMSDSWNTGTSVWAHGAVPMTSAGGPGQVIIGANTQQNQPGLSAGTLVANLVEEESKVASLDRKRRLMAQAEAGG